MKITEGKEKREIVKTVFEQSGLFSQVSLKVKGRADVHLIVDTVLPDRPIERSVSFGVVTDTGEDFSEIKGIIQKFKSISNEKYRIIFFIPSFEPIKSTCIENGYSWVDSAGNADIRYHPYRILISGRESDRDRSRLIRPVFSKKAAAGILVILDNPFHSWSVTELSKRAGISMGESSNLKKKLKQMDWIEERRGRNFLLRDPREIIREILTLWSSYPRKRKRKTFHFFIGKNDLAGHAREVYEFCQENGFDIRITGDLAKGKYFPGNSSNQEQVLKLIMTDTDHLEAVRAHFAWKPFSKPMNIGVELNRDPATWLCGKMTDMGMMVSPVYLYLDRSGISVESLVDLLMWRENE